MRVAVLLPRKSRRCIGLFSRPIVPPGPRALRSLRSRFEPPETLCRTRCPWLLDSLPRAIHYVLLHLPLACPTGTTCTQRATSSSLDCTPAHRTSVLRGSRRTSVHFPVPPAKVNGPVFCSTPNALGLFLGCGCTTAISHRLVTAPNNSEFRAKDWSCPTSNCSRPVLYVCCCCHSHVPLIVCASRS